MKNSTRLAKEKRNVEIAQAKKQACEVEVAFLRFDEVSEYTYLKAIKGYEIYIRICHMMMEHYKTQISRGYNGNGLGKRG